MTREQITAGLKVVFPRNDGSIAECGTLIGGADKHGWCAVRLSDGAEVLRNIDQFRPRAA